MLGVYNILQVPTEGWGSSQTLVLGAASLVLIAAFLVRQAKIKNPADAAAAVPLAERRRRQRRPVPVVAGMFGMFFLGALYLQRILGYDALQVGLAFLPATIVMGTMSIGLSERLIMRFGPRRTLLPGVALIGVGLLLFARTPVHGTYVTDLMPAMILIGFGVGTAFPSLMTLAMSGATPSDSGLASGLVNTSLQVGGAIGLAVLATLASERTSSQLSSGASQDAALNSGYHLAYLIGAALVAVALTVAITVLRSPDMSEMAAHQPGEEEGEVARAEAACAEAA